MSEHARHQSFEKEAKIIPFPGKKNETEFSSDADREKMKQKLFVLDKKLRTLEEEYEILNEATKNTLAVIERSATGVDTERLKQEILESSRLYRDLDSQIRALDIERIRLLESFPKEDALDLERDLVTLRTMRSADGLFTSNRQLSLDNSKAAFSWSSYDFSQNGVVDQKSLPRQIEIVKQMSEQEKKEIISRIYELDKQIRNLIEELNIAGDSKYEIDKTVQKIAQELNEEKLKPKIREQRKSIYDQHVAVFNDLDETVKLIADELKKIYKEQYKLCDQLPPQERHQIEEQLNEVRTILGLDSRSAAQRSLRRSRNEEE